jgi:AAA15 family ATPase/GTPase
MIESLEIKNFRCFKDLTLNDLRRINVVVGANSSGKTALLESIFLTAATSPHIVLKLRVMRGLGTELEIQRNRQAYEAFWRDLFFSFDQGQLISINLRGSPENTRKLEVFYEQPKAPTLPFGKQFVDSTAIVPLAFKWDRGTGEPSIVRPEFTDQGLHFGVAPESFPAIFFTPAFREAPSENAKRFSELSKHKKSSSIILALRNEYDFLEDLSIEFTAGTPIIHAAVRSIEEKMPLSLVSDGVNKLLSVLLSIAAFSKGVVLLDEIENGFYYDRLPAIWSTLLHFCRQYDTQIFASTHSMECLRAILPAIEGNETDFSLIRMDKSDGQCTGRVVDGTTLHSAITQEVEVR